MRFHAAFGISVRAIGGCASALLLGAALAGCASAPTSAPASAASVASVKPLPADADLLASLLAAQFALQDNDLKGGAEGFAKAASLSRDPDVAEEATRLALTTKDWALARTSLARWHALAP
ncbi:MAG TPA: hypothetical protein VGO25_13755, partial [Rhodanobacteraceae bacterium]|nr:hypothetical protein [Rhodanobacteraceae bacterium]